MAKFAVKDTRTNRVVSVPFLSKIAAKNHAARLNDQGYSRRFVQCVICEHQARISFAYLHGSFCADCGETQE